ncbi:MAG: hypothetical protein Q9159_003158 [Coniocarpon cinnabarinum]
MANSVKRKSGHEGRPHKRRKEGPSVLESELSPRERSVSREAQAEPADHSTDTLNIAGKFGAAAAASVKPVPQAPSSTSTGQSYVVEDSTKSEKPNKHEKHKKRKKDRQNTPKAPSGPMMLVTVNDRLGTKKEVPCLGTDTIGDFKKLVAMHIGRKPHEIMLKRQSERALKDQLTLDDYEISSGVQLDLELNTGD